MDQHPARLYNRRAKLYRRLMDHERFTTAASLASVLPNTLPGGQTILDLGCGTGLVTRIILKKYPEAHLIGLDFAKAMLEEHLKSFPDLPLLLGDFNNPAETKTFPAGSSYQWPTLFSLIISAGAVSEYGELDKVLPWIRRLLIPGGLFINVGVADSFFGKMTGKLWQFQPVNTKDFVGLCKQAGFSQVNRITPSHFSWLSRQREFFVRAVC